MDVLQPDNCIHRGHALSTRTLPDREPLYILKCDLHQRCVLEKSDLEHMPGANVTSCEGCTNRKETRSSDDPRSAFDRVIVINLKRRGDRLAQIKAEFDKAKWPFNAQPTVMEAIDGQLVKAPEGYKEGNNVWACLQSHRMAIQDSINNGFESVLVFEDDAVFAPDFAERAIQFMTDVPSDWDFVWLGGHHMQNPIPVKQGVVKSVWMDRCHAYAARGKGLMELYRFWHEWHEGHCDHALSQWISNFNSYCANPWLVGQRGGPSDVQRVNGNGDQVYKGEEWWHEGDWQPLDKTAMQVKQMPCRFRGDIQEVRDPNTPLFGCSLETNTTKTCTLWQYKEGQPERTCDMCLDRESDAATPKLTTIRPMNPIAPVIINEGVGTETAKLLKSIGIETNGCGGCMDMIVKMNHWGVEGCQIPANREQILFRLRGKAREKTWYEKLQLGFGAARTGLWVKLNPLDPAPGILDEAIRLATEQQKRESGMSDEEWISAKLPKAVS